jgi:hypothetical protein
MPDFKECAFKFKQRRKPDNYTEFAKENVFFRNAKENAWVRDAFIPFFEYFCPTIRDILVNLSWNWLDQRGINL